MTPPPRWSRSVEPHPGLERLRPQVDRQRRRERRRPSCRRAPARRRRVSPRRRAAVQLADPVLAAVGEVPARPAGAAASDGRPRPSRPASFAAAGRLDRRELAPRSSATPRSRARSSRSSSVGHVALAVPHAGQGRGEPVVVRLRIGSNLWSWQRAQLTVRPRNVWPTVPTMSSSSSCRTTARIASLTWVWPTLSYAPATRKPVASTAPASSGRSTSPAICSRTNSS